MQPRYQLVSVLIALWLGVAALPCAAQRRDTNRPPQSQQHQQTAPRQERPQTRQESRAPQNARPGAERPPNANRADRPPARARESEQRPAFNPNRPPAANNRQQGNPTPFRDLSPQQKQNYEKFNRLSPQQQQDMRDRARNWQALTPDQKNHLTNDVVPRWKQMPPDRQRAIRQRLGVLQNMPEFARNQHLNDPNFTRGMSEEDKGMLRDLAHMHVGGAPEPPGNE